MSYIEAKAARRRELIESIHGDGRIAPGLPPIVVSSYDPRSSLTVVDDDDPEPGWRGPSYVIENGASLIFPWSDE